MIILRTCHAFRVGFYKETSKVRYQTVNFVDLIHPPLLHFGIERIGCIQMSNSDTSPLFPHVFGRRRFYGSSKVGCKIHLDVILAEDIS